MTRTLSIFGFALLAASSSLLTACVTDICGDGTIERDGVCVPADDSPSDAKCGPGTVLVRDGTCHAIQACDPATTTEVPDPSDPDRKLCVGSGGALSCDKDIVCPTATGGKMNLCGRILDLEASTAISAGTTGNCNPNAPAADGPCALKIKLFSPLSFAGIDDPELSYDKPLKVDECGRFQITGITPGTGDFVAIAVNDFNDQTADNFLPTGIATGKTQGSTQNNLKAFVTKKGTVDAWEAAAGVELDTTGIYVTTYLYKAPKAGVKITISGEPPADVEMGDFYFSDSNPLQRKTIDKAKSDTGANGTALYSRSLSSVTPIGGTGGGLPSGCNWREVPGKVVKGIVFFQGRDAVMSDTPADPAAPPCP